MSKASYQVQILGQKFNFRSDADERHVQRSVDYVQKTLFQLREKTDSVSSLRLALAACLNLADEYFKMKRAFESLQGNALRQLDEAFAELDKLIADAEILPTKE